MSEPGAGTDVLSMLTTAKKDGNKYVDLKQYSSGIETHLIQVYS